LPAGATHGGAGVLRQGGFEAALRGSPPARLPHLLFPSSMPKRRDFPPRALRGSVEPQQFPWAEGDPVFLPIPSAGKSVRVLRGRFILELTGSAPETSGLRRQRFTLYKTLLMPAFSLPRPPGELALPPSPANGTFHYPTSFHPPPAAPGGGSRPGGSRRLRRPPAAGVKIDEATTSVLRSAPIHWGGPRPRSIELLRFLREEPPPRLLRKLLGTSEETEPIPGELGCLGAGRPAALGTGAAPCRVRRRRPPFRGYSSGPGAVKHLV